MNFSLYPRDSSLSALDTVEFSPIMSSQSPSASQVQDEDEYWSENEDQTEIYGDEEDQDDRDEDTKSSPNQG